MARKHKVLALLVLGLVLAVGSGACSSKAASDKQARQMVSAEDDQAGEEEVLQTEEDEFGRTDYSGAGGKAGGAVMSAGYLAMMVGSAILPLFFL